MGTTTEETFCGECGEKLFDDNKPCSKCGSKQKKYCINVKAKIGISVSLKGKLKNKDGLIEKFKQGDSFHKDSGKWNNRSMLVDRRNNRYLEIITDKKTGEVIHKCDEPLSEHTGHGSAKKKKS